MKNIIAMAILVLGSAAFAAPYGDAGCGLGSVVFGSQAGFTQVFAATTNGTSGNQTFGITSGTSNCVDNGAVKGAKAVPAYIESNTFALAKDASRGEGETLANLAGLMGCQSNTFGSALKQNYKVIFVETKMEPTQIEAGINRLIVSQPGVCGT